MRVRGAQARGDVGRHASLVDDATGRVFAWLYDKETLDAAFDVFGRYARSCGLSRAVYVDKASIYRGETADGNRQ